MPAAAITERTKMVRDVSIQSSFVISTKVLFVIFDLVVNFNFFSSLAMK